MKIVCAVISGFVVSLVSCIDKKVRFLKFLERDYNKLSFSIIFKIHNEIEEHVFKNQYHNKTFLHIGKYF